jgi:hypothetical protein
MDGMSRILGTAAPDAGRSGKHELSGRHGVWDRPVQV